MHHDLLPDALLACTTGKIIMPDGQVVQSRRDQFPFDDLLITNPSADNFSPSWITLSPEGYLQFTEKHLVEAFTRFHKLTQKNGRFFTDGKKITAAEVRGMLYASIALVASKPGDRIDSAMKALRIVCPDQSPEQETTRLSIAALAAELKARGYGVRFNTITNRQEVQGSTESGRPIKRDDLRALLHDDLSGEYKGVTHDTIELYVGFIARENQYNPVVELLDSTEWDGVSRFDALYELMGIEDQLSKTLVRKWCLQCVALLFNDERNPFGADGALVLVGPQGKGKTSLLRHLAIRPEWFGEGQRLSDFDKDYERRVLSNWISELGEVQSTFKKSDIDNLKNFVTAPIDRYRLPYGHDDIESVRHTSLCATCNDEIYLIDPTGNRRWWSVPFRDDPIDYAKLAAFDSLQLWAEIYHCFVKGMTYTERAACFRLTPLEQAALAKRNGEHEAPIKAQPEVEEILARGKEEGLLYKLMSVTAFKLAWPEYLKQYSPQQISKALKRCGVEVKRTKQGAKAELPIQTAVTIPFKTM